MAYELGDDVTGYEEEVLDLISKGRNVDRPGIMGAHLMSAHLMGREIVDSSGDLNVEITAGPKMRSPAFGGDVQIVAGPRTNAATLGANAGDVAAVALGVPLALAAGYGVYKAGSALSSSTGPSKPWLYKMNPAYWMKSGREKKFIRAEKEGTIEDVEKARELALAERAYKVTESARGKESQLRRYEQAIEGKAPMEAPAAAVAAAPEGGAVVGDNLSMRRDAAILTMLKKAGVPITANSYLGPAELLKASNIVAKIAGPENAKIWMTNFMQRQAISYGAPDGSVYEIRNGKPTLVSPPAPADVKMSTNAPDKMRNPMNTTSGNATVRGDKNPEVTALFQQLQKLGERKDPAAVARRQQIHKRLAELNAATTSGAHLMSGPTGPSPMEVKVLSQIVMVHGGTITQIVNAKNLGMKKKWTSKDVDVVAAGLLQKMMAESGRQPTAADANIARAATRFWLAKAGGSVMGRGIFVGGDVNVGDFWSGLKTVALSPITVPYWLGKKTVQGVRAVGRKVFGGGKGMSPSQRRQAALAAAAKRNAAAQLRVAAAEKRHEAALMVKEQAQDIAEQEAQAMEAEAAAQAAESVAITAEAMKDVPNAPEAMSGWESVGQCPPSMVGKAALAAATNTPVGRRLRIGACVGRAMKKDPVVRAHVANVVKKAKAGDPKAKRQVTTIKAGMVADKQRLAATKTNAMVTRQVAKHERRKLLALGGSPIGIFSRLRVPTIASMRSRAWKPFTFGIDFIGKGIFVGGKGSNVPPAIPGVPPDILVALTASSNTFGIPPMVAASVIAAAKSGDPKARKDLNEAARVYKAAQKGDPVARRQLASVAADMKSGYAPAAEKAAVMSAAIGATKGSANYKRRKTAAKVQKQRAVAAVIQKTWPSHGCDPVWKCPISFGRTLWS